VHYVKFYRYCVGVVVNIQSEPEANSECPFYLQELNLDLVQFPKPVFISEVRIIPLGARVQADFPGGVRLG
jgi:hypothetical protein